MKVLEKIKSGLTIINIVWFSYLLIRIIKTNNEGWVATLFVVSVLSYLIGDMLDELNQVYLRGMYVASGKWEIK